jgi:hypothetical protein
MVPTLRLAHVVHLGEDVGELNEWYRKVFGVEGFMGWPQPHYLESERRFASMFMVGDLCVETMAPALPPDSSTAVGRAFARRGAHLYSVAYLVDDLAGESDRLTAAGVRVGGPGARFFVPSPRDMAGVRIEFLDVVIAGERHPNTGPLSTARLSHLTLGVDDPGAAVDRFVDLLDAARETPARVRLGDTVIEFAAEASITLAVADLEGVRRHLASAPVGVVAQPNGETVVIDGFGVRYVLRASGTV